ncbi:MAG: ABC transporter ATP-binding protein [Mobilicoccus sp.]|nr:ABC transporter ATP-binding protein [Mobilicoccus sp.]
MAENTETSDVMIELAGVRKRYPGSSTDAVAPLDLSIRRGEFVVFVGPSGCGKTTTLRMINRLVEPTEGRISIDGRDVTGMDPDTLRQGIGYVIQQVGLLPHMTIERNIGLVPEMTGTPKAKRAERARELLDLVGLDPTEFAGRYPRQLSGGQQQRVGVARALAADPPVLLMDEPFGAIDPIARERLQEEFLALQGRLRKTIVMVTHDIDEAMKLGDRIAIFAEHARLAQYDTPLAIFSEPADDFVRDFIGSGASVRRLTLITVGDIADRVTGDARGPAVDVAQDSTIHQALERALAGEATAVRVPDGRTVSLQDLLTAAGHRDVTHRPHADHEVGP